MGRWDLGKKAVIARIQERFTESQLNKRSLDRILEPFKKNYRFQRLEVEWDELENDWNVMASMSPKKSIAKIKTHVEPNSISQAENKVVQLSNTTNQQIGQVSPHAHLPVGTHNDPIPIHWFKTGQILTLNNLEPRYSRWAIGNQPPSQIVNAGVTEKTELEIPPRLFRSWAGISEPKNVEGRDIQVVTIGVDEQFRPNLCKKLKRHRSSGLRRRMQGRFRTLLENWNFNWRSHGAYEADHFQDMGWGGQSMDVVNNMWPLERTLNQNNGNRTYHQQVEYRVGTNRRVGTPYTLVDKWFQIRSIGADRPQNFPGGTSSC